MSSSKRRQFGSFFCVVLFGDLAISVELVGVLTGAHFVLNDNDDGVVYFGPDVDVLPLSPSSHASDLSRGSLLEGDQLFNELDSRLVESRVGCFVLRVGPLQESGDEGVLTQFGRSEGEEVGYSHRSLILRLMVCFQFSLEPWMRRVTSFTLSSLALVAPR